MLILALSPTCMAMDMSLTMCEGKKIYKTGMIITCLTRVLERQGG